MKEVVSYIWFFRHLSDCSVVNVGTRHISTFTVGRQKRPKTTNLPSVSKVGVSPRLLESSHTRGPLTLGTPDRISNE